MAAHVVPAGGAEDGAQQPGETGVEVAATKFDEAAGAVRIPLGRRGDPEEVAAWILRLAGPASTWLTGQVLTVDGGLELT